MGWDVKKDVEVSSETMPSAERRRPGRRWLPWGRFFSPRDSYGRESRTLFFVSTGITLVWVAIILVFIRFMRVDSTMTVTDFAIAIATLGGLIVTLIGAWLGREWLSRNRTTPESTEGGTQ